MTNQVSVSVVMTCRNEEAYIEQAISSVLTQSAIDAISEIIVVDDGSSDGSRVLLENLAAAQPLLKILTGPEKGLSAARNLAIQQARGTHVAFLDGDDYWVPDKLERQLAALDSLDHIGIIYSDFYDFTKPDSSDAVLIRVRPYTSKDADTLEKYFVHDAPIVPSTAIIPRAVFDDVGMFDPDIRLGEDTEMFMRIAERWQFQHIPGGVLYKRRHGKNLTHRLDRLLPVAMEISTRFVERNPQLSRLVDKRMARRYGSAGNDCLKHGDYVLGLKYFLKAITCDPLYGRIYLYLALVLVPRSMGKMMRDTYRRLRNSISI